MGTCNTCSRLREDEKGWHCGFNGEIVTVEHTCSFYKEVSHDNLHYNFNSDSGFSLDLAGKGLV
jgi:hypothetical protein